MKNVLILLTNIVKCLSKRKPLQVRNYASRGMYTGRDSLVTLFYLQLLTKASKRKFRKRSQGPVTAISRSALETNGNTLLPVSAACLQYLSQAVLGHRLGHSLYGACNYLETRLYQYRANVFASFHCSVTVRKVHIHALHQ